MLIFANKTPDEYQKHQKNLMSKNPSKKYVIIKILFFFKIFGNGQIYMYAGSCINLPVLNLFVLNHALIIL